MRILHTNMIGGPTALCAEPFLSSGIPPDVRVFHRAVAVGRRPHTEAVTVGPFRKS
jgi:hypothetical protein